MNFNRKYVILLAKNKNFVDVLHANFADLSCLLVLKKIFNAQSSLEFFNYW